MLNIQPSATIITHSTLALIILFEDQKIGTINDAQELPNISAGIVKVNGSCAASDDFVTSLHDKKMPQRDLYNVFWMCMYASYYLHQKT